MRIYRESDSERYAEQIEDKDCVIVCLIKRVIESESREERKME